MTAKKNTCFICNRTKKTLSLQNILYACGRLPPHETNTFDIRFVAYISRTTITRRAKRRFATLINCTGLILLNLLKCTKNFQGFQLILSIIYFCKSVRFLQFMLICINLSLTVTINCNVLFPLISV